MKPCIIKVAILLLIVVIFSGSSVSVLAAVKVPMKPAVAKAKVVTKKTSSTKKVNLNPPLIDSLQPPGGR